jgi:hypothetical protein
MSSIKARVEAGLKRFESKLGIDREGRTVWVWLLPPGMGLVTAVMVLFMPGLSSGMGLFGTLTLAIFGLLAVTTIASIYLIAFDNDHNQQAPIEDPPAPGHDDGREELAVPSGSSPRTMVYNFHTRTAKLSAESHRNSSADCSPADPPLGAPASVADEFGD